MSTPSQLAFLASSQEFQSVIAADPVLDELERSRLDKPAEYRAVLETLRTTFAIGNLTVQPLTPALWSFLWASGNAFACDEHKITPTDAEIFLWLLAHGLRAVDCEPESLAALASGTIARSGIDTVTVSAHLLNVVHSAVRPLEMLPACGSSSEPPAYDADWLVRICSVAARMSGERMSELMFAIPLSTCCYLFVEHQRENDTQHLIYRRTEGEICKAIMERTDVLAEQFLNAHPETV